MKKDLKKAGLIAWIVAVVLILGLSIGLAQPLYSKSDAQSALGETFDLKDNWRLEWASGEKQTVSLPFQLQEGEAAVSLSHSIEEHYIGQSLNLNFTNAAVRIYMGEKPIYEGGFGKESDSQQAGDSRGLVAVESVGEIAVDIPYGIEQEDIRIEMYPVNPGKEMELQEAFVSKRDVAMISTMRHSVLPLFICVLILLASVVLLTCDVLRSIGHKRVRGLSILAILGLYAIVFCISDTGLLQILFGNDAYFEELGIAALASMPPFIAMFYYRGFDIHYPKLASGLVWVSTILTALTFGLDLAGIVSLQELGLLTFVLFLVMFVVIVGIMVHWQHVDARQHVAMDIAALTCFQISIMIAFSVAFFGDNPWLAYVKDLFMLLYFVFLAGQHVQIMMMVHNMDVKRNVETLENQVRIAEEAKSEAIMANEAKGRFLANMSHEIRTPINAVLGMDEMILRESKEKDIRGYANDIFTAGKNLLSLINDILDFSKIESGKMEIVPEEYEISDMINDLYNMIITRAQAKDLDFEMEIDENIPAGYYGDDTRVRQVIVNILTNAVKYTPSGNVWLRINGKRDGEDEILHIEVEDTGIGIKEEDLPKLFQEYERIEESRNRNIEGTGLGMNITHELLHLMGSKLQVTSVYGKGSTFFFDLRQKVVDESPLGDFKSRIAKSAEEFSYSRSFIAPDAEILVTDDNSMNRKVFVSLLKATKVQITEASGGLEAVEAAAGKHFDIIFMDHMMPEVDGIEAMKRIRAMTDGPCADTPIFALTANAVTGAKEHYLEVGFDGFLSKPIVSDKLEAVIRETLPPEMLKPREDDDEEESVGAKAVAPPEDLPVVDGVEWDIAFLHLPDMELVENMFKEFYTLIPVHADKLIGMYERFPDEAAVNDYRIQVHGMKSSAATVGIIPLAGMAKRLEFAARDGEFEVIDKLHGIFMDEWMAYREKLKGLFGIGEVDDSLPAADMEQTREWLDMLRDAMDEMEFDDADDLMNSLQQFSYDTGIYDKIQSLGAAVTDLDSDKAVELIDELIELIS